MPGIFVLGWQLSPLLYRQQLAKSLGVLAQISDINVFLETFGRPPSFVFMRV
jgi:hypothetical protein